RRGRDRVSPQHRRLTIEEGKRNGRSYFDHDCRNGRSHRRGLGETAAGSTRRSCQGCGGQEGGRRRGKKGRRPTRKGAGQGGGQLSQEQGNPRAGLNGGEEIAA